MGWAGLSYSPLPPQRSWTRDAGYLGGLGHWPMLGTPGAAGQAPQVTLGTPEHTPWWAGGVLLGDIGC